MPKPVKCRTLQHTTEGKIGIKYPKNALNSTK